MNWPSRKRRHDRTSENEAQEDLKGTKECREEKPAQNTEERQQMENGSRENSDRKIEKEPDSRPN
jgi:hypothetical protein